MTFMLKILKQDYQGDNYKSKEKPSINNLEGMYAIASMSIAYFFC